MRGHGGEPVPSPGGGVGLPALGTARSCLRGLGTGECLGRGPCLERAGGVSGDESHCPETKRFSLVFPLGLVKLRPCPDPCSTSEHHPTPHPPLDPTTHPPSHVASRHPDVSPAQAGSHRPPLCWWGIGHSIPWGTGQACLAGSVGLLLLAWPCPSSATGCWRGAEAWGRASPLPAGGRPFGE